jgi:hypothetical protein
MIAKTLAALAFGVAAMAFAGSAQAVTFAEYAADNSDANLVWTQSSDMLSGSLSTTGVGASANTFFSFLTPALASLSNLPAKFTLSATAPASDAAVTGGGEVIEPDLSGTFSFTYTGATPLVVGMHTYTTGANLLSGTFSGAAMVGPANGSTGSLQDAIFSGGTVTFSSDIASFSTTGDKALSLEMTSVLPFFGALSGDSLSSFTSVSTGSFAADIATGGGGGGIPEPMAWAMMVLGFGAIGCNARRQRRLANLASA